MSVQQPPVCIVIAVWKKEVKSSFVSKYSPGQSVSSHEGRDVLWLNREWPKCYKFIERLHQFRNNW